MNDNHITPPAIFMLEEKVREQQKEIDELLERLRECEESLGFYADKKNWGGTVSIKEQIVIHPKDHESYKYGGKRARDYFAKYSGDKKND